MGGTAYILNHEELLLITFFFKQRRSRGNTLVIQSLIYDPELMIHVVGARADITELQWFLFNNALQSAFM